MKNIICFLAATALAGWNCAGTVLADESRNEPNIWTPRPKFNIEGGDYWDTLTFVSGMGYMLYHADVALKKDGKDNFFCAEDPDVIDSHIIIRILNEELSGNVSSKEVTLTLIDKLRTRFPCEKSGVK